MSRLRSSIRAETAADISMAASQPVWRLDVWLAVPVGFLGTVAGFALGDAGLAGPLLAIAAGLGVLFGFRAGALSS